MKIRINYHGQWIDAKVVGDLAVDVKAGGLGIGHWLAKGNEAPIRLDQCKKCGKWFSEDEELYGDNLCTRCCTYCEGCDQYTDSDLDNCVYCGLKVEEPIGNGVK